MSSALIRAADPYAVARRRLVERLRKDGVSDERVLRAIGLVPRHVLLPDALADQAYKDTALPIGERQTISAPGIVARMSEALLLSGVERVLEVGTGSAYQAAVLSHLASQIISIERIPRLAARARSALDRLGVTNVVVHLGDGTRGRLQDAPYDRILVTAGGPSVPEPLLEQLAPNGLLVGPFGPRGVQELVRFERTGERRYTREVLGSCRFVDLVGEHGWTP